MKNKTGITNRGNRPKPTMQEKIDKYSKGTGLDGYQFMYNIPFINQYQVLKNGWDLDYIDIAIFHSISQFIVHGKADRIIDNDNNVWYWVSESKIIKDLPLIPINSNSSVKNRITKLCKCDLIERNPDNRVNGKKHIRLGLNAGNLTYNANNRNE